MTDDGPWGATVAAPRLAQRAVQAGVLDLLDFGKEQSSRFLRQTLSMARSPRITASAILYNLSVETVKSQTQYPRLYLQSCEIGIPNRPETHAGEIRPFAAQLNVGIQNFSGAWDLLEVHALMDVDPEETGHTTEIIAVKGLPRTASS